MHFGREWPQFSKRSYIIGAVLQPSSQPGTEVAAHSSSLSLGSVDFRGEVEK